jgi:hypothetical protein
MARTAISQKAQRVVVFMVALRNPKVAALLMAHGFTTVDLEEGFSLLKAVTGMQMAPDAVAEDPRLLARLRAYEKQWFQVAQATLERHHPKIAQALFAKLAPLGGAQVTISVTAFVERLEELGHADSVYGPDAAAARALLERRGLTAERLAEGRALVNEITVLRAAPVQEVSSEAQKAAEDAMWSWYREWSKISRAAITDRRALRALGFLRSRNTNTDADEQEPGASDKGATLLLPANATEVAKHAV